MSVSKKSIAKYIVVYNCKQFLISLKFQIPKIVLLKKIKENFKRKSAKSKFTKDI